MSEAEKYLDDELKGAYQSFTDDGVSLITGIEHSEVCKIMQQYAEHFVKKNLPSDEEIISYIKTTRHNNGESSIDEDTFFVGAKWAKRFLLFDIPKQY